jgi:hypothetical protein
LNAPASTAVAPPSPSEPSGFLHLLERRPIIAFSGLTLIVSALYLIKLTTSPDYVLDEVLYARVGQNIANSDSIAVTVSAFMVHPPLDFILNAAWESLLGTANAPIVDALMSVRYLNALFCVFIAVITGVTAWHLLSRVGPRAQLIGGTVATLLTATNGFMMSFGRTALIEPAAIAAGAGIVFVAYRIRHRSGVQQIFVLGVLIGLGCLVKQTVLFACLAPLVAAILQRRRQQALINAGAVLVGGFIWLALPIWAGLNGYGGAFWSQQTISIQRLLGLVTTSGVSLPSGSPETQFLRTFPLYSSGYAALLLGTVAFVVIVIWSGLISRRRRPTDEAALVLGYAVVSYGFMGYSFAFGAGNQQFVMYTAPAAALLAAWLLLGRNVSTQERVAVPPVAEVDPAEDGAPIGEPGGTPRRSTLWTTVTAVAVSGVLLLGTVTWTQFYLVDSDNGTSNVSAFVEENIAPCVPINATGSGTRWAAALPQNPVSTYFYGQQALDAGVHLFLLSPKDARYRFGMMSDQLADWITSNGRLLYETPSRSSENLQLWVVGEQPAVAETADCVAPRPIPTTRASAVEFLGILAGLLILVIAAGSAVIVSQGRSGRAAEQVGSRQLDDEI